VVCQWIVWLWRWLEERHLRKDRVCKWFKLPESSSRKLVQAQYIERGPHVLRSRGWVFRSKPTLIGASGYLPPRVVTSARRQPHHLSYAEIRGYSWRSTSDCDTSQFKTLKFQHRNLRKIKVNLKRVLPIDLILLGFFPIRLVVVEILVNPNFSRILKRKARATLIFLQSLTPYNFATRTY
jgi:hypothetical protein